VVVEGFILTSSSVWVASLLGSVIPCRQTCNRHGDHGMLLYSFNASRGILSAPVVTRTPDMMEVGIKPRCARTNG
jgi:hypothetical protein